MTLLEIQDLRAQKRELEERPEVEVEEFGVEPRAAVVALEAKIDELIGGLDPRIERRYRTIAASVDRAVVPVVSGVCYGCFVSIATARAGEEDPNAGLQTCETCGRFLYIVA